jgi:hypothetical protein
LTSAHQNEYVLLHTHEHYLGQGCTRSDRMPAEAIAEQGYLTSVEVSNEPTSCS